jgi:nanoRNase/pAp phosphatase (c-di-AMP/oligoRNAs hydrolase)
VRFLADQEKQKGREASGGGHPNAAGLAMTESSWKDVSEQVLIPAE